MVHYINKMMFFHNFMSATETGGIINYITLLGSVPVDYWLAFWHFPFLVKSHYQFFWYYILLTEKSNLAQDLGSKKTKQEGDVVHRLSRLDFFWQNKNESIHLWNIVALLLAHHPVNMKCLAIILESLFWLQIVRCCFW